MGLFASLLIFFLKSFFFSHFSLFFDFNFSNLKFFFLTFPFCLFFFLFSYFSQFFNFSQFLCFCLFLIFYFIFLTFFFIFNFPFSIPFFSHFFLNFRSGYWAKYTTFPSSYPWSMKTCSRDSSSLNFLKGDPLGEIMKDPQMITGCCEEELMPYTKPLPDNKDPG